MLARRSNKGWINDLRAGGLEIVEVNNDPQVLLDDNFLLAETRDIEFVPARAKKHPDNPLLKPERPWEECFSYTSGIYDDEEELFKLWYGTRPPGSLPLTCYATSQDGVTWDRSNVGIIEYQGSCDNNIVFEGPDACSVLKDYGEPDPNRRYKMGFDVVDFRGVGMAMAASPDGLNWIANHYAVVNGGEFDSHNVIVWDDQRGKFYAYIRHWLYGLRQFRRAASSDLYHWSKPEWVHGPDDDDPTDFDIYTPGVCKYSFAPNLFVSLATVYDHRSDNLWCQMALSRDGRTFKRYRHPFIPLGEPETWDCGSIYSVPMLMVKGDTIHVYYKGDNVGHVETKTGGGIGLGTMRLDGFIALSASGREGVVTTKPLVFNHDGPLEPHKGRLTLNIDASRGEARVELLDLNHVPLPGFSRNDCDPIQSDSTLHIVSWKGNRIVDELLGTPFIMRIYLNSARLYSFQFLAYGTRGRSFDDPEEQRLYDLDRDTRKNWENIRPEVG